MAVVVFATIVMIHIVRMEPFNQSAGIWGIQHSHTRTYIAVTTEHTRNIAKPRERRGRPSASAGRRCCKLTVRVPTFVPEAFALNKVFARWRNILCCAAVVLIQ